SGPVRWLQSDAPRSAPSAATFGVAPSLLSELTADPHFTNFRSEQYRKEKDIFDRINEEKKAPAISNLRPSALRLTIKAIPSMTKVMYNADLYG
ncbi:MAG: hypothetical protein K2M67_08690, partial [Muribaculaceae bacterium]|nr:hypothetical protein [Muribaculaceae bacterium]